MFSGRINRRKFLAYTLPIYIVNYVFWVVSSEYFGKDANGEGLLIGFILAVSLPSLIAMIALHNKRFHDIGMSGWFQLIIFGFLGSLILGLLPGQKLSNKYGDAPN
jgi:uncharacterized membrane protein YhaH (DUF805 family)